MWEEILYPDTGPPPPVPFKIDSCLFFLILFFGSLILFGNLPAIRPTEETVYAAGKAMKDFFLTASKVGQTIVFDWTRQICQSIDELARCVGRIVLSYYTDLLPPLRSHSYASLVVACERLYHGCNTVWNHYKARRQSRPQASAETEAQSQPLSPATPPRLQRQHARRQKKADNKARRITESQNNARDILSCFKCISTDIKHIKTDVNAFHTKFDTLNINLNDMKRRLDNTNSSMHDLNGRVGGIYNQFCDIADVVDRRVTAKESVAANRRSVAAPAPPAPPSPPPVPPSKPLTFSAVFHVAQQEPELHEITVVAEEQEHEHEMVPESVPAITTESSSWVEDSVDVVASELEEEELEHEIVPEEQQPAITTESTSAPEAEVDVSDNDSLFDGSVPDYEDAVLEPTTSTEKPEEQEIPVSAAQEEASRKDREALAASERDPDKLGPIMRAFHDLQRQQEAMEAPPEASVENRSISEESVDWANTVLAERVIKPLRSRRPLVKKMDKVVESSSSQQVGGDDVLLTPQAVVPPASPVQAPGRKIIAMRPRRTAMMGDTPAGTTSSQRSNLFRHLTPFVPAAPIVAPPPAAFGDQLNGTTVITESESARAIINQQLVLDSNVPPAPATYDAQVHGPKVTMQDDHAKAASNQATNSNHQVFPFLAALSNQVDFSTAMNDNNPAGRTSGQLQNSDNHMPPPPAAIYHHDVDWAAQLDHFEPLEPFTNQPFTSDDYVSSTPGASGPPAEDCSNTLWNDPQFILSNQPLNPEATLAPAPTELDREVEEYNPYQPAIVTERTYNDFNAPPPLPAVNDPRSASFDPTAFNYQGVQHEQQQRQLEEQLRYQQQQQQQQQYFASSSGSQGRIQGLTLLQEEEQQEEEQQEEEQQEEEKLQQQWQAQLPPQPQDVVPEQGLGQQALSQQQWNELDEAFGISNVDPSVIDTRLFENEGVGQMMMDENDYSVGAGGQG